MHEGFEPAHLFYSGDFKTFGFQHGANLRHLIALNLNAFFFHCAAAAAGRADTFSDGLDDRLWEMRGEILDDNYGLATAMRGFALQHYAPHFPTGLG